MKRSVLRALPMLRVGALLMLAAFGPSSRARARPGPAPDAVAFSNCDTIIQQGGSDASLLLVPYSGVVQPVIPETNVLSCSLGVVPAGDYAAAAVVMLEWDPIRLVPDPTSIALRVRSFGISSLSYVPILIGWSPPVVVRRSPHLADPPRTTVALDYVSYGYVGYYGGTEYWRYQASGSAEIPMAYYYGPPPFNTPTPLSGSHPVLSHVMCGGDSVLQGLSIVQSVVTTNTMLDTANAELIQRFRVPVETRLRWVELAFGTVNPRSAFVPGEISILDAQGVSTPPLTPPVPLVTAFMKSGVYGMPVWDSHFDFDHIITLEPDHDYWLLAGTTHCYGLYTRTRTGTESQDFLAGIGSFYSRMSVTDGWGELPGQTLCFRLIGEPTGLVDVPRAAPSPSSLRLGVTPNPTRGAAFVIWTGASGAVRFDVIDARGRRVGGGTGLAGTEGRWMWRGLRDDGRSLPAGMYFVRATDGCGRVAVERLAVVR